MIYEIILESFKVWRSRNNNHCIGCAGIAISSEIDINI